MDKDTTDRKSRTGSTPLHAQFEWRGATATTNGSATGISFLTKFAESCSQYDRAESEWIAELRKQGIKAAHPDDGWVDRTKNTIHFAYPQFNDGVTAGSKIALGWASKFRIVEITGTEDGILLSSFKFKGLKGVECSGEKQPRMMSVKRKKTVL